MNPETNNTTPTNVPKTGTLLNVAVLFILIVALAIVGHMASTAHKQSKQAEDTAKKTEARVAKIEAVENAAKLEIDESRYQAVFLTNGQVYFGKITDLTSDTLILENIYYLQGDGSYKQGSGDATTGAGTSLVKLGEELHKPDDKMIIERKNVQFFENLKPDGQVAKGIRDYEKSR